MKRKKIIVNNKTVGRRYLGDKLIGLYYPLIKTYPQGEAVILTEKEKFMYIRAWYPEGSTEDDEFDFERYAPKKITIGDVVIADGVTITRQDSWLNSFEITFKDLESKRKMVERLNKISDEHFNFNIEIKIYGVEV
uniref:Uncharacterized protein n=1 Tax=Siphoviridae sp. ctJjf17 TaxID=2827839 RepID=A0A8S5SAJ6_9CAUD|nr:MAG TPA: hypothetical protein [Siphoviridae sp. ctJjf17]